MSFKDLGLNENILKAIEECGYTEPTPIQAQAIPHILMARDVVGLAQTGTGKTASFTLPMIEILAGGRAKARMPRSLILSPTRELAAQIAENFDTYGKHTQLTKALLVGGTSMADQIKKLDRGVDVLIATPGRLLDLFERGKILLTDIKILVIDEADRMLDMGFIPDIEKIVSFLSPMRQTLLFSATMPPAIKKLTTSFLSNPREVAVSAPATTAANVKAFMVKVAPRDKKKILIRLIRDEKVKNAFIFCNRKRDIDGVRDALRKEGYNAEALHGDMDQKSRTETLARLKAGGIDLLVCSDVAGRGLDVDDLSHVFNYDVPMHADDYVHRIGRTGRAGKEGRAFMLVSNSDEKYVDAIEALIKGKIEIFKLSGGGGSSSGDSAGGGKGKDQKSERSSAPRGQKPHSKESSPKSRSKPKADHKPSRDKRRSKKDDSGDEGSGVVGFGDDVPSFLK